MSIETRLLELGLTPSEAFKTPAGIRLPFASVRVRGDRAYVSGHLPLNPDGTLAAPLGKVGQEVTLEEGARAARLVGLAMLGSLQRELGSLDRITAWLRVLGMVNVAPGFNQTPAVINGFSELIVQVFGPETGIHARSAVGVADLPFSVPVEIEAEVEIRS